jgi:hypothetical protein
MRSVPFTISDVHGGLSEAHGAAYIEDEDLVLEVQTTVLSLIKQTPRVFHIELVDLESVEYKRGLLGDKLLLRTRPLDRLSGVPGVQGRRRSRQRRRRYCSGRPSPSPMAASTPSPFCVRCWARC